MSIRRLLRKAIGSQQLELRKEPRVRLRLNCTVRKKRKRFPARVLDVSEGGLCLLSPVALPLKQPVVILIDIPQRGPVEVEAETWHVRPVKSGRAGKKTWSIGMVIRKAEDGFQTLLPAHLPGQAADAEPFSESDSPPIAADDDLDLGLDSEEISEEWEESSAKWEKLFAEAELLLESSEETSDDCELQLFRVRIKAVTGPRTRTLTLSAASAADAESLARADLDDSWIILEVDEAQRHGAEAS